jgi:hypothetical protein
MTALSGRIRTDFSVNFYHMAAARPITGRDAGISRANALSRVSNPSGRPGFIVYKV